MRPAKVKWFGFQDAAASFVQNAGWFASRKPGSPLRVLSLMAISAALRSRGITMDDNRKRAVIETMELGAHLNDRLDGDPHQAADLRKCISTFSRTFQRDCICNYIKRLRFLNSYRHPAHMARGQHFCHHFLLHLAAKTASALITCRRATGGIG